MKWLSDDKLNYLRTIVTEPDFSSTKYTFVKELARGGMGTVYLAEDRELNRLVAIKVLNTLEVTEDLRSRMVREAQIIARLGLRCGGFRACVRSDSSGSQAAKHHDRIVWRSARA